MNSTNIITELPENQQQASLLAAKAIDPIRAQAYEIESRIGNIAILVEAIFDKLDSMDCSTPELHKVANAINCFANSAMESAKFIRSANEQILTLTSGGSK